MVSWKEERDRLVAQTLAFVQQVAAANPEAVRSLDLAQAAREPAGTPASMTVAPEPAGLASRAQPDTPPLTVAPASEIGTWETATPDVTISSTQRLTAGMLPNDAMYSAISARADITQRVAAFRARQSQIGREREAYYETIQARIRSSLGNDSAADRL